MNILFNSVNSRGTGADLMVNFVISPLLHLFANLIALKRFLALICNWSVFMLLNMILLAKLLYDRYLNRQEFYVPEEVDSSFRYSSELVKNVGISQVTIGNRIYLMVAMNLVSLLLLNQMISTDLSLVPRLLLLTWVFGISFFININYLRKLLSMVQYMLPISNSIKERSLPLNKFWNLVITNWDKNTSFIFIANIARVSRNFVVRFAMLLFLIPYSRISKAVFNLDAEVTKQIIFMSNLSTLGSILSSYLFDISILAKSSDIISDLTSDKGEGRIASQMDKGCDILADGIFSKLVILFLIESNDGVGGHIWFVNLCSYFTSLYLRTWEVSTKDIFRSYLWQLSLYLLPLLISDVNFTLVSMLSLVGFCFLSSDFIIRYLGDLIRNDCGFIGIFPMLNSALILSLNLLLVRKDLQSLSIVGGLGTIFSLFHLNQTGFFLDLLGDQNQDMNFLDIIGNQNKSMFKYVVVNWIFSNRNDGIDEILSFNRLASMGFVALSGIVFYRSLMKIRSLGISNFNDVLNFEYGLFLGLLPIVCGENMDPLLLNNYMIAGGISDNVKKIGQLELIKVDKKNLDRAVYSDIIGDFLKDVLFPLTIIRFVVGFYSEPLFNLSLGLKGAYLGILESLFGK